MRGAYGQASPEDQALLKEANAARAEFHRNLAIEQDRLLHKALTCPEWGKSNTNIRHIIEAVQQLVNKYGTAPGCGPFFLGMRVWLETQRGEARICVWRLRWQSVTQAGGESFTNDSIKTLRQNFVANHGMSSEAVGSEGAGIPEWLMWSISPELSDAQIQKLLKVLPASAKLQDYNPSGEVVVDVAGELGFRKAQHVARRLCCCFIP
eukprot:CAMPEP_0118955694 /NCGR_PEP_ID=MMETSP1169-20130426/60364_1 /TAXON_ID=36882 /ORGANISM="Pyramimonas obovata, Strain CCMP722" /LENGTH=207 /DNA_ID=CAMNT_0006903585 /DNA_START=171 /DNA_END=794 /DNA_ORIENTATION=+